LSSSFSKTSQKIEATGENVKSTSLPNRLRIGCVIHSLDGGGAERVMAGLASRLAEREHQVTLITLDDGTRNRHRLSESVQRMPLDVMSTPGHRVSWSKRLRRLRGAIAAGDFDVVLSFCDATNLLVLLATRCLAGCPPIVVSERSDPAHQSLGLLREWLRDRLYRRAAAVICQSDDVAATLNSRMGVQAIVIPSAVQSPPPDYAARRAARLDVKQTADPIRLIAIGRLEPEKGFERLLKALAMVDGSSVSATDNETNAREEFRYATADVSVWRLVVLGDGSGLPGLQRLAKEHAMFDRIEFRGWVESVWPELADADVFVLPSLYEGFPSALLESMAAGLAVLAVDAGGGVRAAIRHGENGWLVGNSTEELAAGLRRVLADAGLRRRLAASAPEVLARFGWSSMVDAYENVLASRSSRSDAECDTMSAVPQPKKE
jgi:glycosyltransferase involved in cell wall biosynthesis